MFTLNVALYRSCQATELVRRLDTGQLERLNLGRLGQGARISW